ncbi:uncharacterized protein [Aegilops tauschii subsp. strangulata]|uniref:uncharacterized protein n=1 Tax=Aegilops tauschii subsp. strangulata TaxID=200361 RepID=UPI003CC845F0
MLEQREEEAKVEIVVREGELGATASGSEARLLHLPQVGGDLRLAAEGKGPTSGGLCGQKGNCVGDVVGVGVPGTGHGGTHCGPMHMHTVPLPPSASAPLADRSSHSHTATTSRTAGDGFVQSREDRAVWDAETTLPEKESPTTSRPPLACTSVQLICQLCCVIFHMQMKTPYCQVSFKLRWCGICSCEDICVRLQRVVF